MDGDITLDELIARLSKCREELPGVRDWRVRICRETGRKDRIGKVLAVSNNDTEEGTVYLFPAGEGSGRNGIG